MAMPAPGRGKAYQRLTTKQQAFIDAIMSGYDQKNAAIKAGYSKKSAERQANQIIHNPRVIEALHEARGPAIAEVDEIQQFFTAVLRGEMPKRVPGIPEPLFKAIDGAEPKDRIKSAELLAKSYGMFTINHNHSGAVDVKHSPGHDTSAWPLNLAEEWESLVADFAARERELLGKVRAHAEIAKGNEG